jgi:hypothetical protein
MTATSVIDRAESSIGAFLSETFALHGNRDQRCKVPQNLQMIAPRFGLFPVDIHSGQPNQ